jgi:hypothetical protein
MYTNRTRQGKKANSKTLLQIFLALCSKFFFSHPVKSDDLEGLQDVGYATLKVADLARGQHPPFKVMTVINKFLLRSSVPLIRIGGNFFLFLCLQSFYMFLSVV